MWGALLLVLAVMVLFFNAKGIGMALIAGLLVYLGSGKLLETAFSRLQVRRDSRRTYLFPGERARMWFLFENPTYIPIFWLWSHDRVPEQLLGERGKRWVLSLPPKSTVRTSYEIAATRRGVYTLGPVEMVAGEPFGPGQRSGRSPSFHHVVVYPELISIHDLNLPSNLPIGNVRAPQRIYPDPSRLAGVRLYRPGDPRQWIHWKATARTNALHVKEFEHTVALDTVLILNLDEEDYKVGVRRLDSEIAITTAAALANHMTQLREPFGFVTNAHLQYHEAANRIRKERSGADRVIRLTSRKGSGHLMQVLEILAAAVCEPCTDFIAMLGSEARHFAWGATLLIVTPVDTDRLVDTVLLLSESGYRVMIFVTGERVRHEELLNRTAPVGIAVYHVRRPHRRALTLEGVRGGADAV